MFLLITEEIPQGKPVIIRNVIDKSVILMLLSLLACKCIHTAVFVIEQCPDGIQIFVIVYIQMRITARVPEHSILENGTKNLRPSKPRILCNLRNGQILPQQMEAIHMILPDPVTQRI